MRAPTAFAFLAALLAAPALSAQDAGEREPSSTSRHVRSLRELITTGERPLPTADDLPRLDSVPVGDRAVAAGTRVQGPVLARQGALNVYGTVAGDAFAIDGDVIVHPGGVVEGDALAVRGRVVLDKGRVGGRARSVEALPASTSPRQVLSPAEATKRRLGIVLGFLGVLAVLGIGVLMFAGEHLDGVAEVLESRFSRAVLIGVGGQLAILPVLVIGIAALAATGLGILLIPFVVVAYVLALTGVLTLGLLAVARVSGLGLMRPGTLAASTARGRQLRALMIGLLVVHGFWLLAAAFTWHPLLGGLLTAVALIPTWVALTAGLGATILSRFEALRPAPAPSTSVSRDELTWQTPTPVTGVVAARRPTPAGRTGDAR